jgi:hypothetical protein
MPLPSELLKLHTESVKLPKGELERRMEVLRLVNARREIIGIENVINELFRLGQECNNGFMEVGQRANQVLSRELDYPWGYRYINLVSESLKRVAVKMAKRFEGDNLSTRN